jgi:broad specificity phosphatase PhoE
MKRCYLVRHAQTAWNFENRLQGHSDLPLSAIGERQAERLSACFASRHLQGLFTSSLRRSLQTAQWIASGNGHNITPVVEPELVEMHLGSWEGLTPEEIDARFSGAYGQWRVQPSSIAIPGAEPHEAFRQRVRRAWNRISVGLPEGESVVVSHGGVIAAVVADLLGADYDAVIRRLRLDNGGITAVELGTALPHVLWVNATSHLDGHGSDGNWF